MDQHINRPLVEGCNLLIILQPSYQYLFQVRYHMDSHLEGPIFFLTYSELEMIFELLGD